MSSARSAGPGRLDHRADVDASRCRPPARGGQLLLDPGPGEGQLLAGRRPSGIMISTTGLPPAAGPGLGRVQQGPHLRPVEALVEDGRGGRRGPRASGSAPATLRPAARSCSLLGVQLAPGLTGDELVESGRNSCSGGSSRRTVTGRPSMASSMASKSARCWSPSSASAAASSSAVSARIMPPHQRQAVARGTGARSGTGRCPRRPSSRARAASSALSALARTPRRPARISSAQPRTVVSSGGQAALGQRHLAQRPPRRWCRRSRGTRPRRPSRRRPRSESLADLDVLGADHRGLAPPPGHDGGVADQAAPRPSGRPRPPPCRGRPRARSRGGPGCARSPAWTASTTASAVKYTRPTAGPGLAPQARGQQVVVAVRRRAGVQDLVEVLGVDPQHGLGRRQLDRVVLGHGHRQADGRGPGALADPGLQHPELVLLDGELGVHHVPVVPLEAVEDRRAARRQIREVLAQVGQRQRCCGCRRPRPRPGR